MEREAEILSKLEHPNIIKLHHALKTNNNFYLIMDHCDHGDLKSFLNKFYKRNDQESKNSLFDLPRMPENDARYVITHVAEGLKFLNTHNIVHRDIKIDNILVKKKLIYEKEKNDPFDIQQFEFKLGDLGLAKTIGSPDDWIKTQCGTPVCMAPEIVTGCLYNYKVDIWSLGTLLFNLITGTYPFKGRNIDELKDNLRKGAYKIPRDVTVSIECLEFMNSCLKFDQSKRKDIDTLFKHPFLTKQKLDFNKESRLFQKVNRVVFPDQSHHNFNHRQSIEMNTRQSINFYQIYNKYMSERIGEILTKAQKQQIPPSFSNPHN